ncbi:MAG: antA/AntB antirepressor family protein [Bacteroidota bacterium]
MKKYEFIEGQDYVTFNKIIERGNGRSGAARRIEYGLTIDTAKEIFMVENNESTGRSENILLR